MKRKSAHKPKAKVMGAADAWNDARQIADTLRRDLLMPESLRMERPSALDVLAKAPGHRLFRTAEEVDRYLKEERAAWGGDDR